MAYLIKERRMTYEQAHATVKQARMFIQPNIGFERILRDYGEKYGCELCEFKKKTHWFDQYAKKKFTS